MGGAIHKPFKKKMYDAAKQKPDNLLAKKMILALEDDMQFAQPVAQPINPQDESRFIREQNARISNRQSEIAQRNLNASIQNNLAQQAQLTAENSARQSLKQPLTQNSFTIPQPQSIPVVTSQPKQTIPYQNMANEGVGGNKKMSNQPSAQNNLTFGGI